MCNYMNFILYEAYDLRSDATSTLYSDRYVPSKELTPHFKKMQLVGRYTFAHTRVICICIVCQCFTLISFLVVVLLSVYLNFIRMKQIDDNMN